MNMRCAGMLRGMVYVHHPGQRPGIYHPGQRAPCCSTKNICASTLNVEGEAWRPKPRHYSIKASLGTGLGSAPFRWRSTQADQLRGSPRKQRCALRATRSRRRFFAVAQNQLVTGCPKRSRTMKLSFAGNFRGFAPTRFLVSVRR
jgi:hypothetical protein